MNCIAYFDPNASSNPGKVKGMVTFHQCSTKEGVLVAIKLSNLPPNSTRGIHIHEAGDRNFQSKGKLSEEMFNASDNVNFEFALLSS